MLNTITVMGRMTRDPELRHTGSGVAVASFTVAVESDFKDKEGNRKTIFVDCVAWKNTAEYVAKYFGKGRMAIVKGELDIREWTDKDGNKRKSAEIVVENVYFGDSKPASENPYANSGSYGSTIGGYAAPVYPHVNNDFEQIDDDDAQLPF